MFGEFIRFVKRGMVDEDTGENRKVLEVRVEKGWRKGEEVEIEGIGKFAEDDTVVIVFDADDFILDNRSRYVYDPMGIFGAKDLGMED